ncbi:MAG: hypothetical protein AAF631_00780, partial [Pseudomonadota bacterium]
EGVTPRAGKSFVRDPGIPYHDTSTNGVPGTNRSPFAVFGGPYLLDLVTRVSSPALRAVRASKFSVHRRARPEVLAARFHTIFTLYDPSGGGEYDLGDPVEGEARRILGRTLAPQVVPEAGATEPSLVNVLRAVRESNEKANATAAQPNPPNSWLLPMAFPEGSPMHPAYGAGHATVAGACVTILKAFFDMGPKSNRVMFVEPGENAYIAHKTSADTDPPELIEVPMKDGLTLLGELNKLCWNISNGRNIAGVHYFTDYIESAILGENVAIGVLREQMLTYFHGQDYSDCAKAANNPATPDADENVSMTLPLFTRRRLPKSLLAGGADFTHDDPVEEIKICKDGTLKKVH